MFSYKNGFCHNQKDAIWSLDTMTVQQRFMLVLLKMDEQDLRLEISAFLLPCMVDMLVVSSSSSCWSFSVVFKGSLQKSRPAFVTTKKMHFGYTIPRLFNKAPC